jgi:hypothetical protein
VLLFVELLLLLFLLLLLLVFLVPVTAYCLILALVNRRLHPVLVSGRWDAAGLLFAASGLLLFVGPVTIALLFHRSLSLMPLSGRPTQALGDFLAEWWLLWLGYYLVVVLGAVLLLWMRRGKTVIYNVAPADLDRILAQLLDRLGLAWHRLGNRVVAGVAAPAPQAVSVASPYLVRAETGPLDLPPEEPAPMPARPAGQAVFDIEPFATLCNVTLHWRAQSGLVREELEAELERALADVPAPENPAGGWFMAVAGFLLALIFLGIFVLVLNTFFPQRH